MSDKLLLNYKGNLDVSVSSFTFKLFRTSQEPWLAVRQLSFPRSKVVTISMSMILQEHFPK